MKKIAIVFLLLYSVTFAQGFFEHRGTILYNDASKLLDDGIGWFTAPARFTTTDWLYAGGLVAGTFGMFAIDEDLNESIARKVNKSFNNDFWDIPARYGMFEYQNIFSLSLYGIGLIIDHKDSRDLGRLLFTSISCAELTVMSIRLVTARERPFSNMGAWKFKGFRLDNGVQSFPSGHVTVAFAFSTILAEYYDTIWSRIGFYGMASLVWYARMYNNLHWFSDVTFGAILGLGSGLYTMYKEDIRLGKKEKPRVSISPTFNGLHLKVALN